jgi:hypothetical protein
MPVAHHPRASLAPARGSIGQKFAQSSNPVTEQHPGRYQGFQLSDYNAMSTSCSLVGTHISCSPQREQTGRVVTAVHKYTRKRGSCRCVRLKSHPVMNDSIISLQVQLLHMSLSLGAELKCSQPRHVQDPQLQRCQIIESLNHKSFVWSDRRRECVTWLGRVLHQPLQSSSLREQLKNDSSSIT